MQEGTAQLFPRARWLKRAVVALLLVANIVVFAGLAFLWNLRRTVEGTVEVIPVAELPALAAPDAQDDSDAFVLLLVGSDSRDNLPDDFEGEFGAFEGQRADVIMLIRMDPSTETAQLLSLPRDLKVETPDGGVAKINAAFATDTNRLIEQVTAATGVEVNHYVEVDFLGFAAIVDALGGVELYFPHPARDIKSGLDVGAGTVQLTGPQALAYARSRTYEELIDGRWVASGGSDLDRTGRQQQLIFAILDELKRPGSILEMSELVGAFSEQIRTDSELDFETIVDLAWEMRAFGAEDLEAATLPVEFVTIDGISYVDAREPDASRLLASFRVGDSLVIADPTRVDVRNGNGISGSAGETATVLEAFGYEIAAVGNADRSDYAQTLIVVRADRLADGELLAERLGVGVVEVGVVPAGTDIIVYVGIDAAALGGDAAAG